MSFFKEKIKKPVLLLFVVFFSATLSAQVTVGPCETPTTINDVRMVHFVVKTWVKGTNPIEFIQFGYVRDGQLFHYSGGIIGRYLDQKWYESTYRLHRKGILERGKKYFWYVRTHTRDGYGDWIFCGELNVSDNAIID